MAVAFVCVACAAPVGETFVEFEDHRRVAHQRRPVTFTTRMVDDGRPELYLAHCSRCAAEIRTTVPLADPVPTCRSCAEISRAGLEFRSARADAAVVNPTRSDPKETRTMNRVEIILALNNLKVPGRFQTMKTADLEALLADSQRIAAAQEAIDNTAAALGGADVTPPAAAPPALKGDRIPLGATTFVCRVCGKELPTKKFPTISGPDDRGTTCRGCRDAAKGAPRSPKAKTPRASVAKKAPAGPKGLDPATAPFGIGGSSQAEVDRNFKAAWKAAEVDGQVAADIQDQLRAAQHAATLALPRASVAKKVA